MAPEIYIVRPSLLFTHSFTRLVSFEVWYENLVEFRQAASVWYSCYTLHTAGVAQNNPKFISTLLILKVRSTPPLDPSLSPLIPATLFSRRDILVLPLSSHHWPFSSLHEPLSSLIAPSITIRPGPLTTSQL